MADFEPFAEFLADAEFARYRTGSPVDRLGAWYFMCAQVGQWHLRGYGIFAACDRTTNAPVGYTGLFQPITFHEPELSWSLFREHQGKGYATEMARAVIAWAATALRLPPLMSLVHPGNAPSIKVAERLGAIREAEATYEGQPRIVFRHRMPQFAA